MDESSAVAHYSFGMNRERKKHDHFAAQGHHAIDHM